MAKQPKMKWNVYCRVGAVDRFLGATWAPSEAAAIRNVWFREYGPTPIQGVVFARTIRSSRPKELGPGDQLLLL